MASHLITKTPHPLFPHLAYRYEGPEGLIGYSPSKSGAQQMLFKIEQRRTTDQKHRIRIGKRVEDTGAPVEV